MAEKISVLAVLDAEAVKKLRTDGVLTSHGSFGHLPKSFKETIRRHMAEVVGFDTGPICGLARLNGEGVTLAHSLYGNGGVGAIDLLPVAAGDVIFEMFVPADTVLSIGMKRLNDLVENGEVCGEDDEFVLQMLKDALAVGISDDEEEDNVYCFTARIKLDQCVKFVRLDENWNTDYDAFNGRIEQVTVNAMAKF